MKTSYLYTVVDKVAENVVNSFFAVSDADAARQIQQSLDKAGVPNIIREGLVLYKCFESFDFPETVVDVNDYSNIVRDFNFLQKTLDFEVSDNVKSGK